MRKQGIRIEKEVTDDNSGKKLRVVHNYGHGGAGYQTSYGCAKHVVALVEEALPVVCKI